jgi:hypothetical protein
VHVVGRTAQGTLVLARNRNGSGAIPFEVSPRQSGAVVLGRVVTFAAAAILLALGLASAVRWRRRSRVSADASI